uniref:VPS37C subunit of ESCRT-I n=2 Tax=Oryzias melastigma TaxID=30732 RepID=A0A3B3DJZ0_ORYME
MRRIQAEPCYPVNHMEKLQDLSQSELEELLDNPERVESMALESDEIQNIQLEREMALASNRSLAEQNLDFRPRLESQKELLVARYSKLEAFREAYRQHCSQRDGMVGKVSPEAMLSRLQTGSSRTEMESEALADEFLEGSLSLDSFLDRFLSLRSLAHQRRVRIEKLQEILRQKNQANSFEMKPPVDISQSSTTTPWNQQSTVTTTAHHQQEPNSPPQPHPAASSGSDGLPYSPYPVPPTNPPPVVPAAGPIPNNSTSGFAPYAGAGSPFTPTGSYPAPRAAFGPPTAVTCPYPAQPSFPTPHPGSAFGQYTPNNPHSAPSTYPGSYIYGGYCYPSGPPYPSSQSSPGKPVHRPGYRVPQPYS